MPRPEAVPAGTVEVREVALEETLSLRARVLRSHMPGTAATSPSDQRPDTWHLGAFRDGRLVGVVSSFPEEAPNHPGVPAQRFRWMAVDADAQGTGAGTALMEAVTERARAGGATLLWANGRDTALEFYTRLGFVVEGEGFLDATSQLPHHVVTRPV